MSSWPIFAAAGLLAAPQAADQASIVTSPPIPASSGPAGPAGPAAGFVRLPAAMPIDIEIAEEVGSNVSHIDDMFAIRVRTPIMVDGRVVIPAGVAGRGQVVHAARSTGFGKAGELILAARFLDCGTAHLSLRGMRLEAAGKDNQGKVIGLYAATAPLTGSLLAVPLLFISGGKVLIPAGTAATVKLAASIDLPIAGCAASADREARLPGSQIAAEPVVATAASTGKQ